MLGVWGLPQIYAQKISGIPAAPIDPFAQTVQHSRTREREIIVLALKYANSTKVGMANRQDGRYFTGREAIPRHLYLRIKDPDEDFEIGCDAVCPGPPNWTGRSAGRSLNSPLSDASPTPPASPV
jgi:hypothetical protein